MNVIKRKGTIYKYCPDCDVFWPAKKFNSNKSKTDGLSSYCKKHDYKRKKDSERRGIVKSLKESKCSR